VPTSESVSLSLTVTRGYVLCVCLGNTDWQIWWRQQINLWLSWPRWWIAVIAIWSYCIHFSAYIQTK